MMGRGRLSAIGFALACICIAALLGDGYISRLPNHAGYFLVAVDDEVRVPLATRPRHTAFIVVDGLRRDAAETMTITQQLQRFGQCRVSDQGSYTVSRPEYALLSTGLEVDRSGSRNNDLTTPLAAESIWQVARAGGLRVSGSSHLRWFQQLFPDGFDRYTLHETHAADVFAASAGELLDVNVFHPLYVDENAHEHGAASPEYAAAVARADREIAGLLARMDLMQDLVIFTADHGHRDAGGHGGAQPDIKNVLVCFAGPSVARRGDRAAFDGRSTAPALAVLLGLRFPRHMRAGDDGLDVISEIARTDADETGSLSEAYMRDRRAAVKRFRDENRAALEGWLGGPPGTWPRLYEREARAQTIRAAIAVVVVLLCARVVVRMRRMNLRTVGATTAFIAFAMLVIWCVHHLVLGDFDYTVINLRAQFVPRAFAVAVLSAVVTAGAHLLGVRARDRFVGDWMMLVGSLLAMNVGHVFVYGWPLGFPLPPPAARYFPFFGAIALAAYALVGALLVALDGRRPELLFRFASIPARGGPRSPPR